MNNVGKESSGPTKEDLDVYLDRGLRMLDFHERRATQFEGRAATVLALDGVLLGLLFTGAGALPKERCPIIVLLASLALVVASAALGLVALWPRDTTGPDTDKIRSALQQAVEGRANGTVTRAQLLEEVVQWKDLEDENAVLRTAKDLADKRGHWFKAQVTAAALALLPTAVLALQVVVAEIV